MRIYAIGCVKGGYLDFWKFIKGDENKPVDSVKADCWWSFNLNQWTDKKWVHKKCVEIKREYERNKWQQFKDARSKAQVLRLRTSTKAYFSSIQQVKNNKNTTYESI